MLVPFSWLKKYVKINSSPAEIAHLLTMGGVEIDEIRSFGDNLDSNLIMRRAQQVNELAKWAKKRGHTNMYAM